jgi:hypothetical protein
MTDRLNSGDALRGGKAQCPPDMPRGDSNADKADRVKFWLERGNASLRAAGKFGVEWRHSNGHYWIESIA